MKWEADWASDLVWMLWKRERDLFLLLAI